MSKQPVSWLELTSIVRKDLPDGSAFGEASKRAKPIWKEIVAGTHPKYSKKDTSGKTRKKKGKSDCKGRGKTQKHKKKNDRNCDKCDSSKLHDKTHNDESLKTKLNHIVENLKEIIKDL